MAVGRSHFIVIHVHWEDLNAADNPLFYHEKISIADPDWNGFHSDFDSSNNGNWEVNRKLKLDIIYRLFDFLI